MKRRSRSVGDEADAGPSDWDAFVARAVSDIRRDLGDAAAAVVAASLDAQREEGMHVLRPDIEVDRAEARRLVDEAMEQLAALEAREAELDTRTRAIEAREAVLRPRPASDPGPRTNPSGWGRGRSD